MFVFFRIDLGAFSLNLVNIYLKRVNLVSLLCCGKFVSSLKAVHFPLWHAQYIILSSESPSKYFKVLGIPVWRWRTNFGRTAMINTQDTNIYAPSFKAWGRYALNIKLLCSAKKATHLCELSILWKLIKFQLLWGYFHMGMSR